MGGERPAGRGDRLGGHAGGAHDGRPTHRPSGSQRLAEAREPLPTDPATLPALPDAYRLALDAALLHLGLELTPGMREAVDAQARLLLSWAPRVNLTALRTPEEVAREHAADSLAALPVLLHWSASQPPARRAPRLLDLGSGAGYPGLPLAVALPASSAVFVDAIRKKTAFLSLATDAARAAFERHAEVPPALQVAAARAEDLAREATHRGRWDVVTARAVAPLAELIELALPFLRRGGILVAWKRDAGDGALQAELAAAADVGALAGAAPEWHIERVMLPGLQDHRLVVIAKEGPTPERFPRAPAARRRPLLR